MGLYQIFFLDKIPPSAACDESVEIIKNFEHKGAASFANGVLRGAIRQKEKTAEKMDSLSGAHRLSVIYSYPLWMVELFCRNYGEDMAIKIMEEQNKIPPLVLRANTIKTNAVTLAAGFEGAVTVDDAVIMSSSMNPETQAGFAEGLYFVQDLSSQRAVRALSPKEGELLIDVCSCPGGKSFSSAMMMKNKGKILAFDIHKNKLSLVESGAARLGIDIISTAARDAREPDEEYFGKADCVICDAPCSGLGVISKKPDIRFKEASDILRLPELQYDILKNSVKYLKIGGRILYSTCTLNRAENEDITNRFLSENKNFERVGECETVMPSRENDGFFIDVITRIS